MPLLNQHNSLLVLTIVTLRCIIAYYAVYVQISQLLQQYPLRGFVICLLRFIPLFVFIRHSSSPPLAGVIPVLYCATLPCALELILLYRQVTLSDTPLPSCVCISVINLRSRVSGRSSGGACCCQRDGHAVTGCHSDPCGVC